MRQLTSVRLALITVCTLVLLVASICADMREILLAIGLVGRSPNYTDLAHPLVAAQSYLDNNRVIFNYSLSLNSSTIAPVIDTSLRWSVGLPYLNSTFIYNETFVEFFRDFVSTLELDFGVRRQGRNAFLRALAVHLYWQLSG